MLEKGTLIRVKREWYAPKDGPLWVIEGLRLKTQLHNNRAYHCKSIATGKHWVWFEREFDVADKEQDDA